MPEKIKTLYGSLIEEGYDLPNYDQFLKDMSDNNKRTKFHASLVEEGYELPDFETFSIDMGFDEKKKGFQTDLGKAYETTSGGSFPKYQGTPLVGSTPMTKMAPKQPSLPSNVGSGNPELIKLEKELNKKKEPLTNFEKQIKELDSKIAPYTELAKNNKGTLPKDKYQEYSYLIQRRNELANQYKAVYDEYKPLADKYNSIYQKDKKIIDTYNQELETYKKETEAIQKEKFQKEKQKLSKESPIVKIKSYEGALNIVNQRFNQNLELFNQAKQAGDEQAMAQLQPLLQIDSKKAEGLKKGIDAQKLEANFTEADDIANNFNIGVYRAMGTMMQGPKAFDESMAVILADVAGIPQESVKAYMENVYPATSSASDKLASAGKFVNKIAEERGQEKNLNRSYGGSAYEALLKGDVKTSANYAFKDFVQSFPSSMTYVNPATATLSSLGMVGEELQAAKDRGEQIDSKTVLAGGIKAGLEIATERWLGGTKSAAKLLNNLGKEGAEQAIREGVEQLAKKSLGRKWLEATGEEVVGESINQLGSNAVDIYLNGNKEKSLFEGVGDAALISVFGGGVQTGLSETANHYLDKAKYNKAQAMREEAASLTDQAMDQPNEVAAQALEEKAAEIQAQADEIEQNESELAINASTETVDAIMEKEAQIDELSAAIEVATPETAPILEEKINALEEERVSLVEQATLEANEAIKALESVKEPIQEDETITTKEENVQPMLEGVQTNRDENQAGETSPELRTEQTQEEVVKEEPAKEEVKKELPKKNIVDEIKQEIGSLKGEQMNVRTEATRKILNAYRKIFDFPPYTGSMDDAKAYAEAFDEANSYYSSEVRRRLNGLEVASKYVIELAEKLRGNEKTESQTKTLPVEQEVKAKPVQKTPAKEEVKAQESIVEETPASESKEEIIGKIKSGGNFIIDTENGSISSKVIIQEKNNEFGVLNTMRVNNEDGTYTIKKNPIKMFPLEKLDDFANDLYERGARELGKKETPASESKKESTIENFTEGKDLNRIFEKSKQKYGEKQGLKYNDVANRLVNPNKNTIIEVRSNGVVVKRGEQYFLLPFTNTDANYKKWELASPLEVTQQYQQVETNKQQKTTAKEEVKAQESIVEETPALKDVESTAKALEGISNGKFTQAEQENTPTARDVNYGDITWQKSGISSFNIASNNKTYITDKDGEIYQITKNKLKQNDNYLITIKDLDGNEVGNFEFIKNKDGSYSANESYVTKRRKGLASIAYDYLSEDGIVIKPSKKLKIDGVKFWSKSISEAYHKAKQDGSNPELVKAVEELLTNKQQETPAKEEVKVQESIVEETPASESKPIKSSFESNIEALVNPKTGLSSVISKAIERAKPYRDSYMKRKGITMEEYSKLSPDEKSKIDEDWRNSKEYKDLENLVETNKQQEYAVKTGKKSASNQQQYKGTAEQQQGKQEDRTNKEEPISQTETSPSSSGGSKQSRESKTQERVARTEKSIDEAAEWLKSKLKIELPEGTKKSGGGFTDEQLIDLVAKAAKAVAKGAIVTAANIKEVLDTLREGGFLEGVDEEVISKSVLEQETPKEEPKKEKVEEPKSKTSKFFDTISNNKSLEEANKVLSDDIFEYIPKSQDESRKKAKAYIDKVGVEDALENFLSNSVEGLELDEEVALASLLTIIINMGIERNIQEGNLEGRDVLEKKYQQLIEAARNRFTKLGQAVNAIKLFLESMSSPELAAYRLENSVRKANEEIKKKPSVKTNASTRVNSGKKTVNEGVKTAAEEVTNYVKKNVKESDLGGLITKGGLNKANAKTRKKVSDFFDSLMTTEDDFKNKTTALIIVPLPPKVMSALTNSFLKLVKASVLGGLDLATAIQKASNEMINSGEATAEQMVYVKKVFREKVGDATNINKTIAQESLKRSQALAKEAADLEEELRKEKAKQETLRKQEELAEKDKAEVEAAKLKLKAAQQEQKQIQKDLDKAREEKAKLAEELALDKLRRKEAQIKEEEKYIEGIEKQIAKLNMTDLKESEIKAKELEKNIKQLQKDIVAGRELGSEIEDIINEYLKMGAMDNTANQALIDLVKERLGITDEKRAVDVATKIAKSVVTNIREKLSKKWDADIKRQREKETKEEKVKDPHKEVNEFVKGVALGSMDAEQFIELFGAKYGLETLTEQDFAKVRELAAKVRDAETKHRKAKALNDMVQYINSKAPVTLSQLFDELWYFKVLSSAPLFFLGTGDTNLTYNATQVANIIFELPIQEIITTILRNKENLGKGKGFIEKSKLKAATFAVNVAVGYGKSIIQRNTLKNREISIKTFLNVLKEQGLLNESINYFKEVMTEGSGAFQEFESPFKANAKTDFEIRRWFKLAKNGDLAAKNKIVAALYDAGNLGADILNTSVNLVPRSLAAGDLFFSPIVKNAYLPALVREYLVKNTDLRGAALNAEINRMLLNTDIELENAKQKAVENRMKFDIEVKPKLVGDKMMYEIYDKGDVVKQTISEYVKGLKLTRRKVLQFDTKEEANEYARRVVAPSGSMYQMDVTDYLNVKIPVQALQAANRLAGQVTLGGTPPGRTGLVLKKINDTVKGLEKFSENIEGLSLYIDNWNKLAKYPSLVLTKALAVFVRSMSRLFAFMRVNAMLGRNFSNYLTPIGLLRAGMAGIGKSAFLVEYTPDQMPTEVERDKMIAQAITGAVVAYMGIASVYALLSLVNSNDEDEEEERKNKNVPPQSKEDKRKSRINFAFNNLQVGMVTGSFKDVLTKDEETFYVQSGRIKEYSILEKFDKNGNPVWKSIKGDPKYATAIMAATYMWDRIINIDDEPIKSFGKSSLSILKMFQDMGIGQGLPKLIDANSFEQFFKQLSQTVVFDNLEVTKISLIEKLAQYYDGKKRLNPHWIDYTYESGNMQGTADYLLNEFTPVYNLGDAVRQPVVYGALGEELFRVPAQEQGYFSAAIAYLNSDKNKEQKDMYRWLASNGYDKMFYANVTDLKDADGNDIKLSVFEKNRLGMLAAKASYLELKKKKADLEVIRQTGGTKAFRTEVEKIFRSNFNDVVQLVKKKMAPDAVQYEREKNDIEFNNKVEKLKEDNAGLFELIDGIKSEISNAEVKLVPFEEMDTFGTALKEAKSSDKWNMITSNLNMLKGKYDKVALEQYLIYLENLGYLQPELGKDAYNYMMGEKPE